MIYVNTPDHVRMDATHISLIKSIAVVLKPTSILELGIGSGAVTSALLHATTYNGSGDVTVIDNWRDWGGKRPEILGMPHHSVCSVITGEARDVVNEWTPGTVDLLVVDTDDPDSHEWALKALELLTKTGVAFFHDVTNPRFIDLQTLPKRAMLRGYTCRVFNESSRPDEHCQRGLMMAWKNP